MPLVTRRANTGNLIVQITEPVGRQDGDLWTDIGQNPPIVKVNDNGTFRPVMQSGTLVQGDINVANAANELGRLAIGNAAQSLIVNSGGDGLEYGAAGLTFGTEESSTPVTDDTEFNILDQYFIGNRITLPTTEDTYIITALECKNGTAVAGNVQMLVTSIDAVPPVETQIFILAQTPSTAQSGTSAVQKINVAGSRLLRGGTTIVAMINSDNVTGEYRVLDTTSQNAFKSRNFGEIEPLYFDDTAWSASIRGQTYIKIYFKSVS